MHCEKPNCKGCPVPLREDDSVESLIDRLPKDQSLKSQYKGQSELTLQLTWHKQVPISLFENCTNVRQDVKEAPIRTFEPDHPEAENQNHDMPEDYK